MRVELRRSSLLLPLFTLADIAAKPCGQMLDIPLLELARFVVHKPKEAVLIEHPYVGPAGLIDIPARVKPINFRRIKCILILKSIFVSGKLASHKGNRFN